MTGQEMVMDLLRYVGVVGLLPVDNEQRLNRPGLDSDDIKRAIAAINSALQSVQKWGPQDMKYAVRAAYFHDPLEIILTVSALGGQSAVVAGGPPPAWIMGCSVLIAGDTDINRIDDITGNNLSLTRGYQGTNLAGLTANVFADCFLLGEEIGAVLEPVTATPNVRLIPARDLAEFRRIQHRSWHVGYDQGASINIEAAYPRPGFPAYYYVERRRTGEIFLLLAPMPAQHTNATFQAKLRAERVDDTIINDESGVDPGYNFTSLHADEVESVLLPIARWRFFTHPALKNAESRAAVQAEYAEVMATLRQGTALEVSVKSERAIYI